LLVTFHEPVPPGRLQPKLPRDLETVCLKCLEKDPRKRYAGGAELADDLQRFLTGRSVQARPVGRLGRTWRWGRRNPVVAGLVGAVAVCLMVITAIASFSAVRANRQTRDVRLRLYAAQMNLAQRAWEEADLMLLEYLLTTQEPQGPGAEDLRGFEWYYWKRRL